MKVVPVADDDTWQRLASRYRVTLSDLTSANGVAPGDDPFPLEVGMSVLVPSGAADICAAPGNDHAVDVGGDGVLWVRMDSTPDEAAADGGSLRLYSSDGAHDMTVLIADNYVSNGKTVDIVFHEVDSTASYAIDYIDADGRATTVVEEVPFGQLQDTSFCGGGASDTNSAPDGSSDDS